jgi:hypothetical protein
VFFSTATEGCWWVWHAGLKFKKSRSIKKWGKNQEASNQAWRACEWSITEASQNIIRIGKWLERPEKDNDVASISRPRPVMVLGFGFMLGHVISPWNEKITREYKDKIGRSAIANRSSDHGPFQVSRDAISFACHLVYHPCVCLPPRNSRGKNWFSLYYTVTST